MRGEGNRRADLFEVQHAEGFYEPILAENWIFSAAAVVTVWTEILAWEAPEKTFGIIDSFTVLASHPTAYQQCLFEVARNGTRVNNVQFTQPFIGIERQQSAQLRFGENDRIALRYTRNSQYGADGMLPVILFGRISGRYVHERSV